jgi:hypothetical protein
MLTLLSYFIVSPFLLLGFPTPLYYINNEDLQSHEVTVEVFDSHNESIIKETHELAPEEHISQPKPLWLLLRWSMPWSKGKYIYWSEGVYEFEVILDGEIEGGVGTLLHPWICEGIYINTSSPAQIRIESV